MINCIQDDMTRCNCVAYTPSGDKYHPALKAVYERSGAKGTFVKVGLRCPKCGKFYPLKHPEHYYCKKCGVQIMRPMGSNEKIAESNNDLGICKKCFKQEGKQ